MAYGKTLVHLQFQTNTIKLKNLELNPPAGTLFIRCYINTGNKQKIQIETSDIRQLNKSVSLECKGEADDIESLLQNQKVVFELCWKRSNTEKKIFGYPMPMKTKVISRSETSWKDLAASNSTEPAERWITLEMQNNSDGNNCGNLQKVVLKTIATVTQLPNRRSTSMVRTKFEEDCCCRDCRWSRSFSTETEDMFVSGVITAGLIDVC